MISRCDNVIKNYSAHWMPFKPKESSSREVVRILKEMYQFAYDGVNRDQQGLQDTHQGKPSENHVEGSVEDLDVQPKFAHEAM